jgi:hypothetical protein
MTEKLCSKFNERNSTTKTRFAEVRPKCVVSRGEENLFFLLFRSVVAVLRCFAFDSSQLNSPNTVFRLNLFQTITRLLYFYYEKYPGASTICASCLNSSFSVDVTNAVFAFVVKHFNETPLTAFYCG